MLKVANYQLKIYNCDRKRDIQYKARENFISLSEGLPKDSSNSGLAQSNPQISKYLLNPDVMKEISENMGPPEPNKGGRKSKKSRKSRKSRKN
jgi:hypothetical protein